MNGQITQGSGSNGGVSSEACILRAPAEKLTCRVSVGNQRWRALVDTGATMTVIRHDVLNKLPQPQQRKLLD